MTMIICMVLLWTLPAVLCAGTIHVPADQPTIQAGLDAASSGDTVLVASGTYTENITWPSVNGIVLTSSGTYSDTEISGGNVGRIFVFPTGDIIDTTTVISQLTLRNGSADHGGAAYCQNASPKFADILFLDNTTSGTSGAVYLLNSSSVFDRVIFTDNTGVGSGGGAYCSASTLIFCDASFSGNQARYGGGFRATNGSHVTFLRLEMIGNIGDNSYYGGGLDVENSTVLIESAIFENNTTGGNGGGLSLTSTSTCSLTNATFRGNSCGYSGGGIYCKESTLVMTHATVELNSSAMSSGGMHAYRYCDLTITDVHFVGNTANNGGGMYLYENFPAVFSNVTITGNTANSMGGGILGYDNSAVFTDFLIEGNTAGTNGGGVNLLGGSDMQFFDGMMIKNTGELGGGMYFDSSSPTIEHVRMIENRAVGGGGFYSYNGSAPLFSGVELVGNSSAGQGAAGVFDASADQLTQCTIADNCSDSSQYALYSLSGATPSIRLSNISTPNLRALLSTSSATTFDADSCWWGSDAGPYQLDQNPGGLGDTVSTYVDVTPWLDTPDPDAPPIPPTGLFTLDSTANSIRVGWQASELEDVAGFIVYCGIDSMQYTSVDTVEGGVVLACTVTDLEKDTEYHLSVTQYDTDGNESWYSRELVIRTNMYSAPEPFNLISPEHGLVFDDENLFPLTFSWEVASDVDEQDTVRYSLQLISGAGVVITDADTFTFLLVESLDIDSYYWRVVARDCHDLYTTSTETRILDVTLSTHDGSLTGLPDQYSIAALYPNPFNPRLSVVVGLPKAADLKVVVFNLLGQNVVELSNARFSAGYQRFVFDGTHLASGTYYVQATVPGKLIQVKKVVLMK